MDKIGSSWLSNRSESDPAQSVKMADVDALDHEQQSNKQNVEMTDAQPTGKAVVVDAKMIRRARNVLIALG